MARESNFTNMVVTLFAVCLLASAVVGVVYAVTEEPIAATEMAKTNAAIGQVVPEFNNTPSEDVMDVEGARVYPALKDGQPVAYAIEAVTSKGFGGSIKLMVGITTDGTIHGISVLSHSETPGLGAKIDDPEGIRVQFCGKNPETDGFKMVVKKDGGDVDAITASTISSRAFCDAVTNAYNTFKAIAGVQNAGTCKCGGKHEGCTGSCEGCNACQECASQEEVLPEGWQHVCTEEGCFYIDAQGNRHDTIPQAAESNN